MYKIVWRAKETGATGEGKPIFQTSVMAKETADEWNEQFPTISHWVVEDGTILGGKMNKVIELNGVTYVKEQKLSERVIVRCRNAGVWVGTLKTRNEIDTVLVAANRIWRWRGAYTLSEIANNGVVRDNHTRISELVSTVTLTTTDTCEILPVVDGVDLSEVWND